MPVWPCLLLKKKSFWSCSLKISSIQDYSKPVLVTIHKPSYSVIDLYDSQNYEPKKKGGHMNDDGFGSSGVWNIISFILLENVVL